MEPFTRSRETLSCSFGLFTSWPATAPAARASAVTTMISAAMCMTDLLGRKGSSVAGGHRATVEPGATPVRYSAWILIVASMRWAEICRNGGRRRIPRLHPGLSNRCSNSDWNQSKREFTPYAMHAFEFQDHTWYGGYFLFRSAMNFSISPAEMTSTLAGIR